jgi:signal transduction histidine kinase
MHSDFEKTLLNSQLEIQEQTFKNISREIHDNIGMTLTLAKLHLNTINWYSPAKSREKVEASVESISKAIVDLSYLSKTLHTDYIIENGLLNAIELEVQKLENLQVFNIIYKVEGTPVFMDSNKELVIFRIFQEVLNNTIKHAQAKSIKILVNYKAAHMHIMLADNGKGFNQSNPETKTGTGLRNIEERVKLINGTCKVNSLPEKGTAVNMKIPY